jgi:hypothetical protein
VRAAATGDGGRQLAGRRPLAGFDFILLNPHWLLVQPVLRSTEEEEQISILISWFAGRNSSAMSRTGSDFACSATRQPDPVFPVGRTASSASHPPTIPFHHHHGHGAQSSGMART